MTENNVNPDLLVQEQLENIVKSGTTTVGIKVNDGVVIATESKATAGYFIASKQAQKLFEINKLTAATIAGGVADALYVINQLKALSRLNEVKKGKTPEPKYISSICRNILFSGRSFFQVLMIIGGFSLTENTGKLYGVDLLGTYYEEDKFLSFGSGSPFVLGLLEADWKPNLTKAEGIELVTAAITAAKERDAGSGFDLQICTVDKNGFKQIK